jgi:hypothetical protein
MMFVAALRRPSPAAIGCRQRSGACPRSQSRADVAGCEPSPSPGADVAGDAVTWSVSLIRSRNFCEIVCRAPQNPRTSAYANVLRGVRGRAAWDRSTTSCGPWHWAGCSGGLARFRMARFPVRPHDRTHGLFRGGARTDAQRRAACASVRTRGMCVRAHARLRGWRGVLWSTHTGVLPPARTRVLRGWRGGGVPAAA